MGSKIGQAEHFVYLFSWIRSPLGRLRITVNEFHEWSWTKRLFFLSSSIPELSWVDRKKVGILCVLKPCDHGNKVLGIRRILIGYSRSSFQPVSELSFEFSTWFCPPTCSSQCLKSLKWLFVQYVCYAGGTSRCNITDYHNFGRLPAWPWTALHWHWRKR